MSATEQTSLAWWAVPLVVIQTAASRSARRNSAATVIPPIPIGLAVMWYTSRMADWSSFTTRAVGEVVQSLPFVTESPEAGARILEIVGDAVQATRVSRLHFTKDDAFWGIVESG